MTPVRTRLDLHRTAAPISLKKLTPLILQPPFPHRGLCSIRRDAPLPEQRPLPRTRYAFVKGPNS
jgi:hypothetical protein